MHCRTEYVDTDEGSTIEDVLANVEVAKRTVALDFDGVLHPCRRGWTGHAAEEDPVPGALRFVRRLLDLGWTVIVYSARAKHSEGRAGIRKWLAKHGFPPLHVSVGKPTACAYLDDRAVRFDGDWDAIQHLFDDPAHLRPWTEAGQDGIFTAEARQLARWFCDRSTVTEWIRAAMGTNARLVDLEEFELFRDDVRAAFVRLLNRPKTRASLRGEE
jgi:sulfur carrier protein ThiS